MLLEKIKAEKEQLIADGKIKKPKKTSEIFRGTTRNLPYTFCEQIGKEIKDISDEIPFEIPESWEWVRFSSIIELQSGQDLTSDKYNANKVGIPYITGASNIENENVIINRWTDNGRAFAYKGDLLLTCKGTVGTMAILQESKVHIARQIMAIRANDIDINYIKVVLETLVEELKAAAKSMIPGIARDDVLLSFFPLPPLSEQHRIVAKIEELLPYIEQYNKAETQLTTLNTTFPEMLKKSILQEAVQGKLVPQDPTDEPASVLLERIRVEKQKLIKQGKIKKDKHESVIFTRDKIPYEKRDGVEKCIADEVPFELPDNWAWVRVKHFTTIYNGKAFKPSDWNDSGLPIVRIQNLNNQNSPYNYYSGDVSEEFRLYGGELLFAWSGTPGTSFGAHIWNNGNAVLNQHIFKLIFNEDLLFKRYYKIALNQRIDTLISLAHGSAGLQHVTKGTFENTLIPLPPLTEQKRIVAKIEELMQFCEKLK